MSEIEDVVLLVFFQTLLFSLVMTIVVAVGQRLFRARVKGLIVFGLSGLILFWFLAMVPMSGWTLSGLLDRIAVKNQAEESPPADQSVKPTRANTPDAENSPQQITSPIPAPTKTETVKTNYFAEFQNFVSQIETAAAPVVKPQSRYQSWQFWLAISVAVGAVFGFLRLIAGLLSISRLRRGGKTLSVPRLSESLDIACAKLSCTARISIRETSETTAAFTVGWRQPVIFISDHWPDWSQQQIDATLAHEVAHIASRDFFHRIIAHAATALNFFNPLVHALCHQLNFEQELSADDRAADLVGGRDDYVKILAEMALSTEYPRGRLSPMFLPTRKTFFRRIEMLRTSKFAPRRSYWISTVGAMVAMLVGAGIAGLRLPDAIATSNNLSGASPVTNHSAIAIPQLNEEANLRFVNRRDDIVFVIRPATIHADSLLKEALETHPIDLLEPLHGLKNPQIDQLTIAVRMQEKLTFSIAVQSIEPGWWSGDGQLVSNLAEDAKLVSTGSVEIFQGQRKDVSLPSFGEVFFHKDDEKTLVISNDIDQLKSTLRSKDGPKRSEWVEHWKTGPNKNELSFYFSDTAVQKFGSEVKRESLNTPFLGALFPIWEQVDFAVGSIQLGGDNILEVFAQCGDEAGAKEVSQTVAAFAPLFRNILRSIADIPGSGFSPVESQLLQDILGTVVVDAMSDTVTASARYTGTVEQIKKRLMPEIAQNRSRVQEVASRNNLRQIGLAMHNYASVYGHFPPAVLTGPTGKKYSWRIAVLPYLEQQELYDRYRFDEEWNSPHNTKVTAQVPDVLRHPSSTSKTAASYFAVVGKETMFPPGGKGMTFQEITDGTSNTILLVEAKRDTHWAKPEDIKFSKSGLQKSLGGFNKKKFNVTISDGSLRSFPVSIEESDLTALFTRSGGEVVDFDSLDQNK